MAQDSVKSFKIVGIILMGAGVVIIILSFLNYLQDGKTDILVPLIALGIIVSGLSLFAKGRKSQAQNE